MTKKQWKTSQRLLILKKLCICYLCGKLIEKQKDFSLDHAIPSSRGGADVEGNWQPSHKDCNWEKGALTYQEYIQWKLLDIRRNGGRK